MQKTVLLIDDDFFARKVVVFSLSREGYTICEVKDGASGLQNAFGGKFDLIITDLSMPHLDGWQLLTELKKHPATKKVPVIVISGSQEKEPLPNELRAGVKKFLLKPYSPSVLVSAVREIIGDASSSMVVRSLPKVG
jgi:two-component system chemotaxis response regulator CheY